MKKINCIVIVNPLTINMEFSYEYTIIENTESIPLNLEPKQNALFQKWQSLKYQDVEDVYDFLAAIKMLAWCDKNYWLVRLV